MNNFSLGVIIALAIGNLLMSLWVYADAKAKGLKSWLRILLAILTLASTSGLVIYAILRNSFERKVNKIACSQCHTLISNDVKFCPNCGIVHRPSEINLPKKSKIYLLLAGILINIVVIVMVFVYTIFPQSSSGLSQSVNSNINSVSIKLGNKWERRFQVANGTEEHTFNVKGEHWGLVYSSNITKGSIKIDFCNAAGNVITEILPNHTDTLWNVENGKKYKVIVTTDNAKGSFNFKMTDLRKK